MKRLDDLQAEIDQMTKDQLITRLSGLAAAQTFYSRSESLMRRDQALEFLGVKVKGKKWQQSVKRWLHQLASDAQALMSIQSEAEEEV